MLLRTSECSGKIGIRSNRLNGQTYFSTRATYPCWIHKTAEFMLKNPAQDFRIGEIGLRFPGRRQGLQNFTYKDGNTAVCSWWVRAAIFRRVLLFILLWWWKTRRPHKAVFPRASFQCLEVRGKYRPPYQSHRIKLDRDRPTCHPPVMLWIFINISFSCPFSIKRYQDFLTKA